MKKKTPAPLPPANDPRGRQGLHPISIVDFQKMRGSCAASLAAMDEIIGMMEENDITAIPCEATTLSAKIVPGVESTMGRVLTQCRRFVRDYCIGQKDR